MFHEIRFPEDISYGATGGPQFSTDVVKTIGGSEIRNRNWKYPLYKYEVSHGAKSQRQLEALIAFFHARAGRAAGFRYKDWADYMADNQELKQIDENRKNFQLIKNYIDKGGFTAERIIKKPVRGTVNIYINRNIQQEEIAYTLDYKTGVVTFKETLGTLFTPTADFEFDIPARFDNDYMPINIESWGSNSWNNITVTETRGE